MFKSLNLNQASIADFAQEFAHNIQGQLEGPNEKPRFDEYTICISSEKPAVLHVYKNKDGSTTLNPLVGKNQDLSKKMAEFIKEKASRLPSTNKPLSFDGLTEDAWTTLVCILQEEGYKLEEIPLQYGKKIKVTSPQRDRVFLHRYNTGKFMMQGRHMEAYTFVASALCELHHDKRNVLSAQLQAAEVHTTVDALLSELGQVMPNSIGYLGETGCAIVAPALALVNVAVELPDYSCITFPALRGLEFYAKSLLVDNDYTVDYKTGLANYFTTQKSLKTKYAEDINCQHTENALNLAYRYLTEERNGLFHADGVAPVMTRTIEKKEEAVAIAYHALHIIENTYSGIQGVKC